MVFVSVAPGSSPPHGTPSHMAFHTRVVGETLEHSLSAGQGHRAAGSRQYSCRSLSIYGSYLWRLRNWRGALGLGFDSVPGVMRPRSGSGSCTGRGVVTVRVQAAGWYWRVYMFGIGAAVMMGYLCRGQLFTAPTRMMGKSWCMSGLQPMHKC